MKEKRKFPVIIIIILSPLLIFFCGVLIWAVTFRAGPVEKVSEISVRDFYNKEEIAIKLEAANYAALGDYDTFDYDGTLTEILQAAEAMTNKTDTYEAEIFNDILLVAKTNAKVSYCAVRKLADEKRYLITAMEARIEEDNIGFLFPYHFCLAEAFAKDETALLFSAAETVWTSHGYDDWKSFYAKLSRPDIVFDDENKKIDLRNITIVFIGDYEIGFEK